MRRAAITELAGIDAERFNILRRRDQLPFSGNAANEGGWQDFTPDDAFRLHVMVVLMEAHGIGPQDAKGVLRTGLPKVQDAATANDDLWFGEMTFRTAEGDRGFAPIYGTMSELARRLIARRGARSAILINLTSAAQAIMERAVAMGLTEGEP